MANAAGQPPSLDEQIAHIDRIVRDLGTRVTLLEKATTEFRSFLHTHADLGTRVTLLEKATAEFTRLLHTHADRFDKIERGIGDNYAVIQWVRNRLTEVLEERSRIEDANARP